MGGRYAAKSESLFMEAKVAFKNAALEVVETIIRAIDNESKTLSNRDLLEICHAGGFTVDGNNDPHLPHELAETAINLLILRKYGRIFLSSSDPQTMCRETLRPLCNRVPVQSWRSSTQILRQQFSTPATIAYLLAFLMNWRPEEQILEPSAGTGSLAIWAQSIGLHTHVNEIDPRRRQLLDLLGFAPTSHNAEFMNDLLSPETKADCVVMNPPFSANDGRTKSNASKFGFRHVESALERLKNGGKFGVILGNAAGLDTKTGSDFWNSLSDQISVKAIIKIAGREFYKNGTTVDINLILGQKMATTMNRDWNKTRDDIITISAHSVEDAFSTSQKLGLRLDQ
jgi:predicted RNA methylase